MQNGYKDLIVWQKAVDLVIEVYRIVKLLPKEEMFVLGDQMRRAAISIPSNIAEGKGRHTVKDYAHFLGIARGSSFELETQLIIAKQLGYVPDAEIKVAIALSMEINRILNAMILKLSK